MGMDNQIMLRSRVLYPLLIVSVVLIIYSHMIFYLHGQLNFGNYVFPVGSKSYVNWNLFWNPFLGGGTIVSNPQGELYYHVVLMPSYPIFAFFGSNVASKFFIIFSTLILAFGSYFFLLEVVKNRTASFLGTLFLILNPLFIQIISNGDFYIFAYEGLTIFSYIFAVRWIKSGKYVDYNILLAGFLFSFSVALYQLFIASLIFSFLLLTFLIIFKLKNRERRFCNLFLKFSLYYTIVLSFTLPFIISSVILSHIINGNSSALTPGDLEINSASFLRTLLLLNYNPNVGFTGVEIATGPLISNIWLVVYSLLIFLMLAGFLFFKKKGQFLYLTFFSLIIAFFGSGTNSPIGIINKYLHSNLIVFTVMNAGYYWSWLILTLIYSLLIALFFSALQNREFKFFPRRMKRIQVKVLSGITRNLSSNRKLYVVLITIFVVILLIPVSTQSYYSNIDGSGIRSQSVPSTYYDMSESISRQIGTSGSGVAFFNPSYYITINNNTSNNLVNPAYISQEIRTPELPIYGNPPAISNFYNYWLYSQFYNNLTNSMSSLFGLEGVSYFVVLNNTNPFLGSYYLPNSVNTSTYALVGNQSGIKELIGGDGYSIFKSNFLVKEASYVKNYTEVLGSFDTLNNMASVGFNLSNLAVIYPNAVTSKTFFTYIGNTSMIILPNINSIYSLEMPLLGKYEINLTPSFNKSDHSSQWTSSSYYNNNIASTGIPYFFNFPSNVLVAKGDASLNAKYVSQINGKDTLLIHFFGQENVSGNISIDMSGMSYNLNTSSFSQSKSDGELYWALLPINVTDQVSNLTIKSISGINGVQSVYIVPNSILHNIDNSISKIARNGKISFLLQDKSSFVDGLPSFSNISNSWTFQAINNSNFNVFQYSNLLNGNIRVISNSNGINVFGNSTLPILLRVPYDSEIITSKNTLLIPAFGGVDMILSTNGSTDKFNLHPILYSYTQKAIIIPIFIVMISLIMISIDLKRGKKYKVRNGKY